MVLKGTADSLQQLGSSSPCLWLRRSLRTTIFSSSFSSSRLLHPVPPYSAALVHHHRFLFTRSSSPHLFRCTACSLTRPESSEPHTCTSKQDLLSDTCDTIYRSSTAREQLCERLHEPSPEIALRLVQEFRDDPGVWRSEDWAARFVASDSRTSRVALVLERIGQWYAVRKAPQRVRMEQPWDWYPTARLMKRRFVYHHGPTNSGKTHAALSALVKAKSGVYCAPLKALAGQVWSRLNEHVPCDLLIGDERRFGGAAEHVSCTVEMTPVDLAVDVGVIDEVQMIADRDRGWAWTRAVLGLPAREIHLCGEEGAIPVVRQLLHATREAHRLQVVEHGRLVPLQASPCLHGRLDLVENGDCVVCFSRNAVLTTRAKLERLPGVAVSHIYGAMPFEVREAHARAFNDGVQASIHAATSGSHDSRDAKTEQGSEPPGSPEQKQPRRHVLVSTDAIAYGLNMNIERIVFTALHKFDGKGTVVVPPATTKQICGRAGRFGLVRQHAVGRYTTMHDKDYALLERAMSTPPTTLTRAGLLPTSDILQLYVQLRRRGQTSSPDVPLPTSFYSLMEDFAKTCRTTSLFFPCDLSRSLLTVAKQIDSVAALSLEDRILFCYVPLNDSSPESLELLRLYAHDHARGGPVALRVDAQFDALVSGAGALEEADTPPPRHEHRRRSQHDVIARLERIYRQCEMYGWLSWRFGKTFVCRQECSDLKLRCVAVMQRLSGTATSGAF